ncbi:hypothetical protein [Lactococcus fujiensis]|uniref:hypothetical protein n=1 Tax=Lactococcus fujiensis TaxID=610251 RepID=UPI0006CFCFC3|nr:hypothetical protein [Lactococcus fujiensis]
MKRVDKEQLISIKSYVAKNAKMTKEEQLCLFDIADKLLFYQENGEYEIFIKRNGSRFNFKNFQAKNFDYDDFYHAISYLLQLKLCGIAEYDFYDQFFPIGEFKLNVKPQKN